MTQIFNFMKWISIKQKKPLVNQTVFALIKNKIPVIVKFSQNCFTDDGLEVENISHWRPIPEFN